MKVAAAEVVKEAFNARPAADAVLPMRPSGAAGAGLFPPGRVDIYAVSGRCLALVAQARPCWGIVQR